jgi:hypothetical protein
MGYPCCRSGATLDMTIGAAGRFAGGADGRISASSDERDEG